MIIIYLLIIFITLYLTNIKTQSTETETIVPLTKFSYGVTEVYVLLGRIIDLVPEVSGTAKKYTINPLLPKGSKLNENNGYIELGGDNGVENTYTIIVSNSKGSLQYKIIVKQGGTPEIPVKFLKLGYYDNYQLAVGYPFNLPIYVQGPIIRCTMTGNNIDGMIFDIQGFRGTPTTINLTSTILKFSCYNGASKTNEIEMSIMVLSKGIKGLIGNFWKWNKYRLAFPCRTRTNAFTITGGSLEVRKVVDNIDIINDNYFKFYPDFKDYFGVTFTGYINIPSTKLYIFSTVSSTGSYLEIDENIIVDHMTSCHVQNKKFGNSIQLTQGYHRITLGCNKGSSSAYCKFYWDKLGNEEEISNNDLTYVPLYQFEYEYIINSYEANVVINNNLIFHEIKNNGGCTVSPNNLPSGIIINEVTGVMSGQSNEITTFADYYYTISCNTNYGRLSHKFSIEIRDFTLFPSIPYIVLKRATDRRVNVNPDMYYQINWVVDHSCYPSRTDLYWRTDPAPGSKGTTSCVGSGRTMKCILYVSPNTVLSTWFDPGPEYDNAYQMPGTMLDNFERTEFIIVSMINNDPKRAASLLISITTSDVTPIPGWVYFGVWTNDPRWNPLASQSAIGDCTVFTLYDRNGVPLLDVVHGYSNWLIKQGLLLEPNEYTIYLSFYTGLSGCVASKIAEFNLTMDNTYQIHQLKRGEEKVINLNIRRLECAASPSDNLPLTSVGGIYTEECPSGQIGLKTRTCLLDPTGTPYWSPIENTCRPYIELTYISYGLEEITVPIGYKMILKPKITGDYDSFMFSEGPLGNSKFDQITGIIELLSSSNVDTRTLTITVKQSGASKSLLTTLKYSITQLTDPFEPIRDLYLYPSSQFNFAVGSQVYVEFRSSGLIQSCKIEPSLPNGLEYDFAKIYGAAITSNNNMTEYSLQCSNSHSKSNIVKFKSSVISAGKFGSLYAKYWIYNSPLPFDCNIMYEPDLYPYIITSTEKIENEIQHELSSNRWNNIGPRFTSYWGVMYTGYLITQVSSTYTFKIKSQHGSLMEIDGILVANSTGCRNFNDPTISNEITLTQGKHTLKILYFHTNGDSGLEIYWQYGSSVESKIPNNNFEYILPSVLNYKYKIASYILGETIPENTPDLLIGIVTGQYSIDIELPPGLIFDKSTGIISGTPTISTGGVVISRTISVNIIIDGNSQLYTIVIFIEISDFNLPYNVRVTLINSIVPITEYYLIQGETITLKISYEGNATYFDYSGVSVPGFQIDRLTGEIKLSCDEEYNIDITVYAGNSAGKSPYNFRAVCSQNCGTGQEQLIIHLYGYIYANQGFTLNIIDKEFDKTILSEKIDKNFLRPITGSCVDVNRVYLITGLNYDNLEFSMDVYLKQFYYTKYIIPPKDGSNPEYKPFEFTLNLNLSKPILRYDNSFYSFTIPSVISIEPNIFPFVSNCLINPPLPRGFMIDRNNCTIYGNAEAVSLSKVYTITPINGGGTGELILITIEVIDCGTSGQISYKIEFRSGNRPNTQTWSLETFNGNKITGSDLIDNLISSTIYYLSGCGPSGDYKLIMFNTERNEPWDSSSYLKIELSGNKMFTFIKSNYERQEIQIISFDLVISSGAIWKIRETAYNYPNWYEQSYNDLQGFKITTLSGAPLFIDATMYLSTQFDEIDYNDYSSFFLNITYDIGILIYLNGKELYRKFLPKGQIYYNTLATGRYDTIIMRSYILPSLLLKPRDNTLSIELHRDSLTSSNKLLFSAIAVRNTIDLIDGCIYISKEYGIITNSSNNAFDDNKPDNALDNNPLTKWIELGKKDGAIIQPFLSFTIGSDTYSWFNQIGWRSISDENTAVAGYQPSRIILYGNNDNEWEEIITISNINVQSEGQLFKYYLYDNYKMYNNYKFVIDRTKEINSDVRIADLLIGTCQKYYCDPQDGFPATAHNTKVSATCINGYVGTMFRECIGEQNPIWGNIDLSRCRPAPPSNLKYPLDSYELVTYRPLPYIIKPNVSFPTGFDLNYEIYPIRLPGGLLFNTRTGEITGQPQEKIISTIYIIRAIDPLTENGVETDISISITAEYCLQDGEWLPIQGGDIQRIQCPKGFNGFKYRTCVDGIKPEWDINIKEECTDERKDNSINPIILIVIGVFAFIAICAIGFCIYARCRSSKRKNARLSNRTATINQGKSVKGSVKTKGKSVRL